MSGRQSKGVSSIRVNFIMNAILTMSSFIFPLITFRHVSGILLPAGTGRVAFATSLISYFNIFAQLGIPTYGVRVCAQVRDDREQLTRTAHELLMINLITCAVTYAVLFAALLTVPKLQDDRPLYLLVSLNIILTSIGMEWIYKALEQYTYITVRSIIFKFIALFAMFMTIHEQKDYVIYGGITILAASASNILNFINVHKYIDMRPVGGYNLGRHLKLVAIFFAMACASTIYTHLDTVMLGFMKTDTDVGYYNASVRIKSILISIVTSLGTVLLPRASYYIEHGEIEEFRRISRKALNFVFLIACPLIIYFILFARPGIYFLSNKAYEGAVAPMRIILPTLLFVGITNITGIQMLVPMGKEIVVLWSEIGGAVTDIILNALLIPKLASQGAAIGTVAAEMVVLIIQYAALRKEVAPSFKAIQYPKIIAGIVLASLASFWVIRLSLGNFVTLLISAVIFFAVYGGFLLAAGEPLTREIVNTLCDDIKRRLTRSPGRLR